MNPCVNKDMLGYAATKIDSKISVAYNQQRFISLVLPHIIFSLGPRLKQQTICHLLVFKRNLSLFLQRIKCTGLMGFFVDLQGS